MPTPQIPPQSPPSTAFDRLAAVAAALVGYAVGVGVLAASLPAILSHPEPAPSAREVARIPPQEVAP